MNFSLTTFDKSGKLLQIEYALNRVAQGKMALGIKATNGVVIASDKKVASVLVDAEEYQKIQSITPSTGMYHW
jgi:20S proteasome subunit alpha 2